MRRMGTVLLLAGVTSMLAACSAGRSDDTAATTTTPTTAVPAPPTTAAPTPPTTEAADVTTTTERPPETVPVDTAATDDDAATAAAAAAAGVTIPLIPIIVVPSFSAFDDGASAIADALHDETPPFDGTSVTEARCADDGSVLTPTALTTYGTDGTTDQVGDSGVFEVAQDGSGSAVFDGGVVDVAGDGSGTAVTDDVVIEVEADLSGTYVGPLGVIELNSDGSGSLVDDVNSIEVDGRGGGTWTGALGVITNNGDGSGEWVGNATLVENRGDGTGTVDFVDVAMDPMPPVPPVGRFQPVQDLVPVGRSCGLVITLGNEVLFDFDKADIRPEAGPVLDDVADYLTTNGSSIQINGHTDSIGTDEYNQDLSERRAAAVWAALQERGVTVGAELVGSGETQPVAPNQNPDGSDNPAGRQLNRRVEIVIFD